MILAASGIHSRQMYEIEAIDAVLRFLRSHSVLADSDPPMPRHAGMKSVLRRIQEAFDRVRAPSPRFVLPLPFRLIRTVGELRAVGISLKNCVRCMHEGGTDHWFQLADGSTIYITSDAQPLLAALNGVGPDLWMFDGIYGPENSDVGVDVTASLINALESAGVRLVRKNPARALWMLGRSENLADCEDAVDEAALVA